MIKSHDAEKKYFENLAKFTLCLLFQDEYKGLVNFEKPDLVTQDYRVGVEVTRVLQERKMRDERFFNRHFHRQQINSLSENKLNSFLQNGNELITEDRVVGNGSMKIVGYASDLGIYKEEFIALVRRKLINLNKGNYAFCDNMDLYAFWPSLFDDEIEYAIDGIGSVCECVQNDYRYVYVDNNSTLFRINTRLEVERIDLRPYLKEIKTKAKADTGIDVL